MEDPRYVNEALLRKYGVKELLKSFSGRLYLGSLQKKYWREILQPSDPLFEKVYGSSLKEKAKLREANERLARSLWEERQAKKEFELRQKMGVLYSKKFRL